jgi:hypothetical protein
MVRGRHRLEIVITFNNPIEVLDVVMVPVTRFASLFIVVTIHMRRILAVMIVLVMRVVLLLIIVVIHMRRQFVMQAVVIVLVLRVILLLVVVKMDMRGGSSCRPS